jgi:hypothetical protein
MASLSRGWKLAATFGLVATIVGLSASPASAGLFRRKIIVENQYYIAQPVTTVQTVPAETVTAVPAAPAAPVYQPTQVITQTPVQTNYVVPVVVEPVIRTNYVVPTRVVVPRRVYYAYPY